MKTDFGGDWEGSYEVAIQADGKIVSAGASNVNGTIDFAVARYLSKALVDVDINIKPNSCSNPVNIKSKGVLPVAILAGGVSLGIKLLSGLGSMKTSFSAPLLSKSADMAAESANVMGAARDVAADAAPEALEAATFAAEETVNQVACTVQEAASYSFYSDIALWFFFGFLFTIVLIFLVDWIRERKG